MSEFSHIPRNIEGIVLRSYPLRESDLILRVMTRDLGKLSLLARGAKRSKRRFGGTPEIFEMGSFEIRQGRGSLPLLSGFRCQHISLRIRESLEKFSCAALICESFDLLIQEDQAENGPELFHALFQSLADIDQASDSLFILRAAFQTLSQLLVLNGSLNKDALPKPTRDNLLLIIEQIEKEAERKLQSRSALEHVLSTLKRPASTEPRNQ